MNPIFVGLGSNRGDRLAFLRSALRELRRLKNTALVHSSSVYETEPVGKKDQAYFLNAVVELSSELSVTALQRECRTIETLLGRTKTERWGPREIDLDLLYYGREVYVSEDLVVPHPERVNRRFVLLGLHELAPDFLDPVLHRSMADLLQSCQDQSAVAKTQFSIDPE
ncbi:MAG: 2-amino-4-hydroxy-6-hydroxymethyldihydropteridine diphosphokinase [Ignavibacteriales bacterium]|nr:2-amino-4-hydroxy-6-hydroxymethyldihydropteridine diphosphokinase [Ignavibacteriales bacterium]